MIQKKFYQHLLYMYVQKNHGSQNFFFKWIFFSWEKKKFDLDEVAQ